eukprot:scaffold327010_cov58-Tisochrysis_lutea.AAC.2
MSSLFSVFSSCSLSSHAVASHYSPLRLRFPPPAADTAAERAEIDAARRNQRALSAPAARRASGGAARALAQRPRSDALVRRASSLRRRGLRPLQPHV